MKVEIDADELCELEAERDWWREKAMDISMDFDKQDEKIADIVCYDPATESYYIDRLLELASDKGYE